MYVDSHCHLDGHRFDSDREQVILRARDAGIANILCIGTGDGPGTLDCAIRIAEQHPFIYATVGIHPHEVKLAKDSDFDELRRLADNPKVIGWGEIGLDYYYDHSPRDLQKHSFILQMEMAASARLPIIIHCRPSDNSENAWDDCLFLIEQHWKPTGLGGILHCFTGTWAHAQRALALGFMISFAGNVSFPKAQQIRESAQNVPSDRMLIETDAPFLAPVPHRGKRNEPAFVKETARHIGELRGVSMEEVGSATAENFYRFFSIPRPAANA
jgi:TatD DNase family protein